MTAPGAYGDEMGRFLRLDDEELSRMLAGEAGIDDEASDAVASFLGEVRATSAAAAPDDVTRAAHIAAISKASRLAAEKGNPVARPASKAHGPVDVQASGLPKWRRVMNRTMGLALKAAAGTVAASLSMVGFAYAGVDLPGEAAEKALERVTGLELPNQGPDEEKPVADDAGRAEDGDGRATGDEKSAAGRAKAAEKSAAGRAKAAEKSAAGRAKAAEKSGGRSESAGAGAADEGRATASEKSNGASDSGAGNAGTSGDAGSTTAEEASKSGQEKGSAAAEAGASNAAPPDEATTATPEGTSGSGQEKGSSQAEEAQSKNPTGNGKP